MLGMAMNSAKLFFAGKLFKENKKVIRQMILGVFIGLVAGIVVGKLTTLWLGAIAAGAVAGFIQPILFKDLKYA